MTDLHLLLVAICIFVEAETVVLYILLLYIYIIYLNLSPHFMIFILNTSQLYDQILPERLKKLSLQLADSGYQGCRGPIGTAAADVGQDDSRDATPSSTEASTGGQATRAANMQRSNLQFWVLFS